MRLTASTLFVSCARARSTRLLPAAQLGVGTSTARVAGSDPPCAAQQEAAWQAPSPQGEQEAAQLETAELHLEAVDARQTSRVGHIYVAHMDVCVLDAAQRDLVLDLGRPKAGRALAHDEGVDLLRAQVARPHDHHLCTPQDASEQTGAAGGWPRAPHPCCAAHEGSQSRT